MSIAESRGISPPAVDIVEGQEEFRRMLYAMSDSTVEAVSEVAKEVLPASIQMLPTSARVACVPVEATIAVKAPCVASVAVPAIDSAVQAATEASVGYLVPKVEPCVDAKVPVSKDVARGSIDRSLNCFSR